MRKFTFHFIDGTSLTEYRGMEDPKKHIKGIFKSKLYDDGKGRVIVVDKIKFINYE
jgi:hypothetical protein